MKINKKLFERRMPSYLGGLLIGLGAMMAIFQVKRAMMPKFHPAQLELAEATVAPGGGARLVYSEEPGYFLIPGMPTRVFVSRRQPDKTLAPLLRFSYGDLVEKNVLIGPLVEEGSYELDGEFYICAQPGVAHCTKLSVSQDIKVTRDAPSGESRWEIDLTKQAQAGLDAGGEPQK